MGITLGTDDFIKNQQEIFRTAYDIASQKIREAGQKQKKYYNKGRTKKASDILTLGTQVLVKRTAFQERHKIADVWEDDVYVLTDQPHKDIPVYTVENLTDETIKTVHRNLLLPLPTILDWMRPYDPDTLVKPIYNGNNADEVNSDNENEDSTDDDDSDGDGDSDSSGDEPVCIGTRSQRKKQESPNDNNANVTDTVEVTADGPEAQEIDRQSDSESYRSVDSGSDGEDGCVGTHSPPLAIRKSARERKLPAKYDGFIIGPLRQLSAIFEKQFLGKVYREQSSQMCI